MVIVLLIVYLLIKIVLLGIGIGIGFLLHWMLPTVDLGMGILIGVTATGIAIHFFIRLWASLIEFHEEEIEQKTGRKVKLFSLAVITARGRTKRKASP